MGRASRFNSDREPRSNDQREKITIGQKKSVRYYDSNIACFLCQNMLPESNQPDLLSVLQLFAKIVHETTVEKHKKSWELMFQKRPSESERKIEDKCKATKHLLVSNEAECQTEDSSEMAKGSWYIGTSTTQKPPVKKQKITNYFTVTKK
jgi:hypothetical protein